MITHTFGLIGLPLSHSFSQKYFSEKFDMLNLQATHTFKNYELKNINQLEQLLEAEKTLMGFSVTVPYKESILSYLHQINDTAKQIGAVNCVKVSDDKILTGYNTDIIGFQETLKPLLKSHHQRALILGTGGASKAVAYVLKNLGVDVWFVTRNKISDYQLQYDEVNEHVLNAFHLIVNATPLGMFPDTDSFPNIPYHFITNMHLCIDLIYNPSETLFMNKCKSFGATTENGYTMLCAQADAAWKIWNS